LRHLSQDSLEELHRDAWQNHRHPMSTVLDRELRLGRLCNESSQEARRLLRLGNLLGGWQDRFRD
jgi:hypothetical protein